MIGFARCSFALALSLASLLSPLSASASMPAWLALEPGAIARVDIAPWLVSDEPEAALTEAAASLQRNFSDDATRPDDVVYEPIGVRVRIVRVARDGRTVLVRGIGTHFEAYAPIDRLVPEVPPGTSLVAAGGFGGFADFYPALGTRQAHADRIATGSRLVVLAVGTAPYDPDSADLVRVRVRVVDGNLKGRTGWIAVSYTGVPGAVAHAGTDVAEQACSCRLVQFTRS